jgi:putative LysE/RhtB family amino acid efflux pump
VFGGGSLRLAFGLASAAVLIAVGVRTAWVGFNARAGLESEEDVVLPRRAFLTTIAATALNPLTIALWTVSFPAAAPAAAAASNARAVGLLLGACLGTLTWYGGLAIVVGVARRRISAKVVAFVDVGSGCGLVGFGSVVAYRSLHQP